MNQKKLIAEIYPFRRDLISEGYDNALNYIAARLPLKIHQFYSGSTCWTWTIPYKWTCHEAYIEKVNGERILDQKNNPLHIASYSIPIDQWVTREELKAHLHIHPHLPEEPPFVFYYYQKQWGFACSKIFLENLRDEKYHVVIKTEQVPGALKVGEYLLEGKSDETFFLCAHLDHPMQANDGLSGVITGLSVMEQLSKRKKLRYTYRMLITPETIGSIAYLSRHEHLISTSKGGLFLEMTGLDQAPALQLSYTGNTEVDQCLQLIHKEKKHDAWVAPYRELPGNDERQFNAPGVRIPMLSYSRALPNTHPEKPFRQYHSSADNLDLICDASLEESSQSILAMIDALENNFYPRNLFKGEVFLSGFNLTVDRNRDLATHRNRLRIMDMIDGTQSTVEIAEALALPFSAVCNFIDDLEKNGLVEKMSSPLGR